MTLPTPNLDNRTFLDLVRDARARIADTCPEWTDLSVHDPGMVLVEVFAYLTETMLYQLNRLPEKAYISFLNLLGVSLHPPVAATVELEFTRTKDGDDPITVPVGTHVTVSGANDPNPPVFVTMDVATIASDASSTTVTARHCDVIDGELLGAGTGHGGQRLSCAHPPMCATDEESDVLLGVEIERDELPAGATAREFDGGVYEIWRPVHTFANCDSSSKVYVIDRATGTIVFAPELDLRDAAAVLDPEHQPRGAVPVAAVPPTGRRIRLWYRTGGGGSGNVGAHSLETLRDKVDGVHVTNPAPARGGRDPESVDAAIVRGPQEFFALRRAVTARDFELLARTSSGAVARARAFTRAEVWKFADPGEVEVVIVPDVPPGSRGDGRLSLGDLVGHQVPEALQRTKRELDLRRPLGTRCVTTWAHYKAVSVSATVHVRHEEDAERVRERVLTRLYETISPLPTRTNPDGWAFGEALRVSNVYRMLEQAEPGVRYVEDVTFTVEDAPADAPVPAVAVDHYQPRTWYAACNETLFRSTNDGQGWEPVGRFGNAVRRVIPYPRFGRPGLSERPGRVAVVVRTEAGSEVHVSSDLGERFEKAAELQVPIEDATWIDREGVPALLLATDAGLYELQLTRDQGGEVIPPFQVSVDPSDPDRGFYSVIAFPSDRGELCVALAAQARLGVYLSTEAGNAGTFSPIGETLVEPVDSRVLAVQIDGPTTWLWIGAGEPDPDRPGSGAFRTRLFEAGVQWEAVGRGWGGGTCWGFAFPKGKVAAASQSGGVLTLDPVAPQLAWQQPTSPNVGLPLRDRPRFEPVVTVAARPDSTLTMVGGPKGVFRTDAFEKWDAAAQREPTDIVTIPDTWLLCSGEHHIEVVKQRATPVD